MNNKIQNQISKGVKIYMRKTKEYKNLPILLGGGFTRLLSEVVKNKGGKVL